MIEYRGMKNDSIIKYVVIAASIAFLLIFLGNSFFPLTYYRDVYSYIANNKIEPIMENNERSPEVSVLNGHAKYVDIQPGTGAEAKEGSEVSVGYVGALENGTIFDQNEDENSALTFVVGDGRLIPGFDAGVVGLREGGKRVITIQPTAGYGDRAVGTIPANSVLIFTVTLYSVK